MLDNLGSISVIFLAIVGHSLAQVSCNTNCTVKLGDSVSMYTSMKVPNGVVNLALRVLK